MQSTVENEKATRRAALARNLCARICDERRSLADLRRVDRALIAIEREADPIELGLLELIANAPEPENIHDRFDLGGEG